MEGKFPLVTWNCNIISNSNFYFIKIYFVQHKIFNYMYMLDIFFPSVYSLIFSKRIFFSAFTILHSSWSNNSTSLFSFSFIVHLPCLVLVCYFDSIHTEFNLGEQLSFKISSCLNAQNVEVANLPMNMITFLKPFRYDKVNPV